MRSIFTFILNGFLLSIALGQGNPLWLRYPAISPDGQTILFEYKGDIYSVPSSGGTGTPLTLSESYEFVPVWSHDGKSIAFASDRNGNFDVFVMPATGGDARRLTFHSVRETPSSFSADDKSVLFSTHRQEPVTNTQFPISLMSELYSAQLSQFDGEDRNPVFGTNDTDFYYLCEQSGSLNVVRSTLTNPGQATAITHFTRHPVRFLTHARNNTLCFSFDGELYTLQAGGEPKR